MFTGLIGDLGTVSAFEPGSDGASVRVRTRLAEELGEGDSIAVSGVCLTATQLGAGEFTAQVMAETLARLPPSSQLVAAAAEVPLTVVVSRAAARADTDALEAAGAQVLVATGENEPARVRSALDQLGALGVASALLEGGPHLAGAFLDADEIDEIRLFLAPLLLGGSSARDPLEGQGVERISEALHALTIDCERIGEDLLISARLRDW